MDDTCPRCGRPFGDQRPALSRVAEIYVCAACGLDEAAQAFYNGIVTSRSEWPVEVVDA